MAKPPPPQGEPPAPVTVPPVGEADPGPERDVCYHGDHYAFECARPGPVTVPGAREVLKLLDGWHACSRWPCPLCERLTAAIEAHTRGLAKRLHASDADADLAWRQYDAAQAEVERLTRENEELRRLATQVIVIGTLAPGEELAEPVDHVVVHTALRLRRERDEAEAEISRLTRELESVRAALRRAGTLVSRFASLDHDNDAAVTALAVDMRAYVDDVSTPPPASPGEEGTT